MFVFDIPVAGAGGAMRTVALGSCRVRQPVIALVEEGKLSKVASGLHKSHTARHALFLLRYVAGEVLIPEPAIPLLFGTTMAPKPGNLAKAMQDPADVVIVEVCSMNQFLYLDTPLQETLVAEKLVKPYGRALLAWYRDICLKGVADEASCDAALTNLRAAGIAFDHMEALLRGVRLERQTVEDIARDIQAIQQHLHCACLLVGPFAIPGATGSIMTERRNLIANVRKARKICNASRFDPSLLVTKTGRKKALMAGGQDVYHYAKPFLPVVGEALVRATLEAIVAQTPSSPQVAVGAA